MSNEIRNQLDALARKISAELDRIHDEALAKLRALARATEQRTRVDRL